MSSAVKPEVKPKPNFKKSEKPADLEVKRSSGNNEFSSKQIPNSVRDRQPNKIVEALIKHNGVLDETLQSLTQKQTSCSNEISDLENTVLELEAKLSGIDEQISDLQSKTSSEENEMKREIQKYLAIYERLKADEKLFKQSCNEELERLQLELASYSNSSEISKSEAVAQLEKYKEKIECGRVELGSINQKVATMRRQIEQVPNRAELREYRLRFSELYNQVSATHRSTKQFYSLYNSLEDTKRYLEKELSLLNSIAESYQMACGSASGREDFLKQLQSIHDGMKETNSRVDKKLFQEKVRAEKLQAEIQKLLDLKVSYERCLKDLEAECKRNDHLLAECKSAEQTKPQTATS